VVEDFQVWLCGLGIEECGPCAFVGLSGKATTTLAAWLRLPPVKVGDHVDADCEALNNLLSFTTGQLRLLWPVLTLVANISSPLYFST
jgi:hypothetical protein